MFTRLDLENFVFGFKLYLPCRMTPTNVTLLASLLYSTLLYSPQHLKNKASWSYHSKKLLESSSECQFEMNEKRRTAARQNAPSCFVSLQQ